MRLCMHTKSLQLCPTLCDPMDYSPPGSSVHGNSPGKNTEWVAMPSSRGSSSPRDRTHISYVSCMGRWVLYHKRHLGTPKGTTEHTNSSFGGTMVCSAAGGPTWIWRLWAHTEGKRKFMSVVVGGSLPGAHSPYTQPHYSAVWGPKPTQAPGM